MPLHQTPGVQNSWPPSHMHFLVLSNSTHCFTSSVELPSCELQPILCNSKSSLLPDTLPSFSPELSISVSLWFSPLEPIEHSYSRFAAIFSPSKNKLKNYKLTNLEQNCTSSFFTCKNSSPQEIFSCSDTTWWGWDLRVNQNPISPIKSFIVSRSCGRLWSSRPFAQTR